MVAASLVVAGSASAAAPVRTVTDWPQFHFGSDKTGYNPGERTLSPSNVSRLTTRWNVAGADGGSPIVVGERVFATVGDRLVAVQRDTGAPAWSTSPLPGAPSTPPAALASGDGLVFVAAGDYLGGDLLAYRQSDGALEWSAPIGGSSRGPTVAGDNVYVGSSDHNVYAFDLATGAPKWTATLPDEVQSLIAVADGRVFAASMDGTLSAFTAADGAVVWTTTVGGVFGGGAAVSGGVVYIATNAEQGSTGTNDLWAFKAKSGRQVWRAPLDDDVHSVPAVDGKTVYIGLIDIAVKAFAAPNGKPRWSTDLGDGEVWSSIAVANGVLYLTSDVGTAYALDTHSGVVKWSDTPPNLTGFAAVSSPAVVGGALYVGFGGAGLTAYALPG